MKVYANTHKARMYLRNQTEAKRGIAEENYDKIFFFIAKRKKIILPETSDTELPTMEFGNKSLT